MRHSRLALLLIMAAFLAVEPVVHSHPLIPGNGSAGDAITNPNLCAICAVGTNQIVVAAPAVLAPAVAIERLAAAPMQIVSLDGGVALASRAPPAA